MYIDETKRTKNLMQSLMGFILVSAPLFTESGKEQSYRPAKTKSRYET